MKLSRLFAVAAVTTLLSAGARLPAADGSPLANNGYTVTIEISANEKGEPESMRVVSSEDTSPGDVLTKMALAMASKTQLPPRLKDGKPVKFTARAPFFFPIEGDEGPAANQAPRPRAKSNECRQPVYPPEMLERGEVGGAVFELVIDTTGQISRLTTMRASHPEFEKSAREALQNWKFIPAEKDGKPVESRWRLAIVFENSEKMADLKWRIAPRPSLGSFVLVHDNSPVLPPAAAPAAGEPAPADAPAPAAGEPAPASPATPPTK